MSPTASFVLPIATMIASIFLFAFRFRKIPLVLTAIVIVADVGFLIAGVHQGCQIDAEECLGSEASALIIGVVIILCVACTFCGYLAFSKSSRKSPR